MDVLQFVTLVALGLLGGVLSGLVGIGGVSFVPDLIYVGGWRIQEAVAASLAIVLFTAALVGAAGYILTGFGDLLSLPPLVVGSIAGAWLGVRLRDLIPGHVSRRGFAVFMVLAALRILGDGTGIL